MNRSIAPSTLAHKLAQPFHRFFALEAASGLLLFIAVAIALIWANVAPDSYHAVWEARAGAKTVHFWMNEGLMTMFFFVVGLEIRRELHAGELSDVRRAALPVATALGGVVLPILIFVALNHGRAGAGGWAIPMATDIAFALGVLSLFGSRVPAGLRILLLALAVIDDIAAIVVIAIWFGTGIAWHGFAIVGAGLGLVAGLRLLGVRAPAAYVVPGAIVWFGVYEIGVHPTLAGVVLGLLTPARPPASIAERLIDRLHPIVGYVVMPAFALANAGVALGGAVLDGDGLWLFAGIVAGLVVGKPLGIVAAGAATSRLGVARMPGIALVGIVGGIGFTMSLFIAQLAFASGPLLETAKLAVIVGSAAATLIALGYGALRLRR